MFLILIQNIKYIFALCVMKDCSRIAAVSIFFILILVLCHFLDPVCRHARVCLRGTKPPVTIDMVFHAGRRFVCVLLPKLKCLQMF